MSLHRQIIHVVSDMSNNNDKIASRYTSSLQKDILNHLNRTRHSDRNKVIFLLSCKAGLRAKEIAGLEWRHVLNEASDDIGDRLRVPDKIAKGKKGGRNIKLAKELKEALKTYYHGFVERPPRYERIIQNKYGQNMRPDGIVKLFHEWFKSMRLEGFSSHSGRRTFITNCARKISLCGGSLDEVRILAGHSDMKTTLLYIDANRSAMDKVVDMI